MPDVADSDRSEHSDMKLRRASLVRRLAVGGAVLTATGLLLAGCGGGSSNTSGSAGSAGGASSAAAGATGQSASRQFPGASGEVAAISGTTLQVQNSQTQTAVSYTGTTTFTKTVTASAGALKAGLCAVARPARSEASGAASGGTATTQPTRIAAATVELSQPVNGLCTGGFGDFGGASGFDRADGARPSGFGTSRPSGRPSSFPSGARDRAGGGFAAGATGKITSVSGSTFTVASVRFSRPSGGQANATASPAASPSSTTTSVTVTTGSSTTYTETVSTTATAVQVGSCVTALGKSDDTGAIDATSIAISAKQNGQCSSGFGSFGGSDAGSNGGGPNA